MSLSVLKELFVDVDDFITIDNIGHGICLACAFFQGYNFGRGNGRCVEADLRGQVAQAMEDLIRVTRLYEPSDRFLSTKSKNVIKEWYRNASPDLIREEATSLPSDQYWNVEIIEFYIETCLHGSVELYYFKMVRT